ncbi:hypothetical protein GJ744_003528 [Endocarpon pusillum]|uniref:Uncharacterized protein n=1 Tax=Endocarpon pusillum TaxID=364733 RepID=A0A8H7E755_9EURO|nr:hypothetical protein GJ744_003528 [Endocarpon pusillum]
MVLDVKLRCATVPENRQARESRGTSQRGVHAATAELYGEVCTGNRFGRVSHVPGKTQAFAMYTCTLKTLKCRS